MLMLLLSLYMAVSGGWGQGSDVEKGKWVGLYRRGVIGQDEMGLTVAAGVKKVGVGGGGCSDLSYRWVEGAGPLKSLSQVPLWLLRDVKAGVSGSNTDEPLSWRCGGSRVGG